MCVSEHVCVGAWAFIDGLECWTTKTTTMTTTTTKAQIYVINVWTELVGAWPLSTQFGSLEMYGDDLHRKSMTPSLCIHRGRAFIDVSCILYDDEVVDKATTTKTKYVLCR